MQAALENADGLGTVDLVVVLPKRWADYMRGMDKPSR